MKRTTPFLWFDDQADETMRFYVSIFKDSKVLGVTPGPTGKAMSVRFELAGREFMGLNAGPEFKFTEAISFFVSCTDQAEVDALWAKLSVGAEAGHCGSGVRTSSASGGRSSRPRSASSSATPIP
jgi:predicted 3-demethylubiquinone-9 3-methyltransferase (glyoxalase superfamily)